MSPLTSSRSVLCMLLLAGGVAVCLAGAAMTRGESRLTLDRIDHTAWSELLGRYVDQAGLVAYGRWRETPADVQRLRDYLAHLEQADLSQPASKSQRLAFWINAYNALTIQKTLSPARDGLRIGGIQLSPDQIEQRLRDEGDPRIHFALVCGARGCPRLLNRAYTPADLDAQLESNGRDFFADPTKLTWDPTTKQLSVSPILQWNRDDFGQNDAERLRRVSELLPTEVSGALRQSGPIKLRFLEYDSRPNDQESESMADEPEPPLPPE